MRSSAIAIIPARGGSKGIPRKNIRDLHGKPLLAYTVTTALKSECFDDVVVSTDHEEIAHIAEESGARVHHRPPHLADDDTTLDAVVYDAVAAASGSYDLVVTLQPTAPLLSVETLRNAMQQMEESPETDTLISVVNDPRLSWVEREGRLVPNYIARVNRQHLPALYKETGAFFISRMRCVTPQSRFGANVAVFEIPPEESIDIDTMQDWWIVEKYLDRKKVAIRVDGERKIGFGHMYRMLLLANRLLDHPFRFFLDESQTEAVSMVERSFYPLVAAPRDQLLQRMAEYEPEIAILDMLDTTAADVLFLRDRGIFVVSFEDLGPGMLHTDLTINALYERPVPDPHVFSGPNYYCLREDFAHTAPPPLAETVSHIIITFGGADPTNQTKRTISALSHFIKERNICVTIILGLGYPRECEDDLERALDGLGIQGLVTIKREVQSMARELKNANLIVTSCGRTMYEIASLGIPAVLIAQNTREMQHVFGHSENGFACLGLGRDVSDAVLLETVREICEDAAVRAEMRRRMLSYDFRGGQERVTRLILDKFRESRKYR